MTLETIREYCLAKKGVVEDMPFGPDTLVFKVEGKLFLLTQIDSSDLTFNAKCDPEYALELRDKYDFVQPGYHMNKKHWNTLKYNGTNAKLLYELIDHSYSLIVQSLPKSVKSFYT